MSQRGWFYSSEEASAEILRQLEEDVDSELKLNEMKMKTM